MTLTPWLGARVPVATHATAVVEVVPTVVAASEDKLPETILKLQKLRMSSGFILHVKESSVLAPIPKSSASISIETEAPKLCRQVRVAQSRLRADDQGTSCELAKLIRRKQMQ